ncbi:MAG TPA: hypothetical protein DER60_04305 [Syntrophomonas sp.]|nr:hypothetical protein [Syntrophomonas sp.]
MFNRPGWMLIGLVVLLLLSLAGCSRSGSAEQKEPASKESVSIQSSGTAKAKSLAEILAQGKNHPGVYCEFAVKPDEGSVLQGKLWIAGNNLRSETIDAGSQSTAIFIRNSKGYNYMFTSGDEQAIKVTDEQPAEDINPVHSIDNVDENTQPLGKEVLDGKNCVVVQYKQDEVDNRIWLWEDHGLPIRIESTYNNSTTVMEYSNYKFEALPESLFELPSGMKVMELPGIGSGTP